MINFDFALLDTKPNAVIALKFIDNQQNEVVVKTALKISPAKWDADKQRPTNIYLKKYKKLNAKLDALKVGVSHYLQEVALKQRKFSANILTRLIKKCCLLGENNVYLDGSLSQATDNFINSRLHLISTTTYRRYMVFFRLLKRFEGHQRKQLMIKDVNSNFVKEFIHYGEAEMYSPSTIHRTIHFIRTVLNFLEKRGIRTYVYELELPKLKKQHCVVSLTEDELITIKKTDVPPQLKAAKDWLMISCYTGQRVSDFMNFNLGMMETLDGKPCLSFTQQKTQKTILLPLHPSALHVLSENGNNFPTKLPAQKYNEQIKEIVRLAGITALIKVRTRNGFRATEKLVHKWEAITSHIGRRSFASNFYGKIPTPLLMEATGHSTEQMFQRYISSTNTERTRSLATYLDEMYRNKFVDQHSASTDTATDTLTN
ncbi:site-specific integrase [Sphingobacterium sp. InxBP1]|uniref:phage integrase SAM-like domain-containing protein n=1 Tax=Sphingobacterium TaxID=28453 RepID=UPI0022439637|nr:tyrosine-type recombinase/integrase [Sphingobacterium sp. InxBP1]MCW8310780.1 site-specific integrase [Sphingobacterium sp. InxBP1]